MPHRRCFRPTPSRKCGPAHQCRVFAATALAALTGAGCATYAPLPLDSHAGATVARLAVPASSLPTRPLARHRFDPSNGLDVTEVAMLAVANDPELRVKRDELGVARAQAFAAGLMPDPQIGADVGYPTSPGDDLTRAFDFGLTEDVSAILTRSARTAAARAASNQVNLELLWAEWQTVARARLLFDTLRATDAREQLLRRETAALAPVARAIRSALAQHNLTYADAASGLNALADARQQLAQAVHEHVQADHDLHVLLGLAPQATLHLVGAPWDTVPGAAQVQQALADLPRRRPDLLALQAGYATQEARVRGAILAQFPAITLGFTRARDTSNIYTTGFSIGITLPLFDRNRGGIAVARATRRQLHDAYAARLLATRSDMDQLQRDLNALATQIEASVQHTAALDAARAGAMRAWQAGTLDSGTYLAIRGNALAADLELLAVRAQRNQQAIALATLLGGDWNHAATERVPANMSITPGKTAR